MTELSETIAGSLSDSLDGLDYLLEEILTYLDALSGVSKMAMIDKVKKKLKASLATVQDRRNTLEELLLAEWEVEGTSQVRVAGVLVFLKSQKWAKPKDGDREAVVKALQALGMDEFVNFNSQTLSSYVRKADTEDYEVPQELQDVIEVTEVFGIQTRK